MRFFKRYPGVKKYTLQSAGVMKSKFSRRCKVCKRKTYWLAPNASYLCGEKCFKRWAKGRDLKKYSISKTQEEVTLYWSRWLKSSDADSWGIAMRLKGVAPSVVTYIFTTEPLKPEQCIVDDQIVEVDERHLAPQDWIAKYKKQGYKLNAIFRWAWYFELIGEDRGIVFARTDYFRVMLFIATGSTDPERTGVSRFYENHIRPFWAAFGEKKRNLPAAEVAFQDKVRRKMKALKDAKKAEKEKQKRKLERKEKREAKRKEKARRRQARIERRFKRRKRTRK